MDKFAFFPAASVSVWAANYGSQAGSLRLDKISFWRNKLSWSIYSRYDIYDYHKKWKEIASGQKLALLTAKNFGIRKIIVIFCGYSQNTQGKMYIKIELRPQKKVRKHLFEVFAGKT